MKILNAILLLPSLLRPAFAYIPLSDSSLNSLPFPGEDFDINNGALLSPILVERVPGSPGSDAVLQHFVDFFTQQLPSWTLSWQNSTSTTPTSNGKEIPFRNLIATYDPPWVQQDGEVGRLALVAHFDSKLTPTGFIGATDSAAPCAMILHAARSIDAILTRKWEAMAAAGAGPGDLEDHKGVQILLLDGEEAFKQWTSTDSIYGARSLAEEWESTFHPAASTYSTPLASIDLFVLLDLLGSANPTVPSYFKTTHWAYQHLASIEERLRALGKLKTFPGETKAKFLPEMNKKDTDRWFGGMVEDDHIPFMARGVEILHLIAHPFPTVWHTMDDDAEHLDIETTEDWAVITAAFVAEWMDLEDAMSASGGGNGDKRRSSEVETEKSELS